jgi:hypothetical protein
MSYADYKSHRRNPVEDGIAYLYLHGPYCAECGEVVCDIDKLHAGWRDTATEVERRLSSAPVE